MKTPRLINAMNYLDDDLVSDAIEYRPQKRNQAWMKWGAMAACLCLIVAGVMLWENPTAPNGVENPGITVDESGVTIPSLELSLSADETADMIGFFIYEGRCYVQYEWLTNNPDIVGEKLGTATGLIDEWTPKDGYVDFAGSIYGDFYTVKGYDPSFMLCIAYDSGEVSVCICNTGITLKYGSELYEDRLFLAENYTAITYETRTSWYHDKKEISEIADSKQSAVTNFIAAINEAEFLPWDTVPQKEGYTADTIYETEIYHVYFEMTNGTTVHLRLYENGYVRYQGLLDVCVKADSEIFDEFIDILSTH